MHTRTAILNERQVKSLVTARRTACAAGLAATRTAAYDSLLVNVAFKLDVIGVVRARIAGQIIWKINIRGVPVKRFAAVRAEHLESVSEPAQGSLPVI